MTKDIALALEALEGLRSALGVAQSKWPYRGTIAEMIERADTAYRAVSRLATVIGQTGGTYAETTT